MADEQQEAAERRAEAEDFLKQLERTGVFEGREDVLEQLRALAAMGVHPLQVVRRQEELEEPLGERLLVTFDLHGVARYLIQRQCRRVVVMCGAGISTSAGIPDFRTPGTGLYHNLQRFNLPQAESIFDLDYFKQNPAAFYELCKEMWPGNYSPTPAHYFIRLLSDKGVLLRCYSQNIDSLERQAGLPAERLVAAHGNFDSAHVIDTEPEQVVEIAELKRALDMGEEGWRGLCSRKGNLVKPKIVFFGEQLPDRFLQMHRQDLNSCDLLVVLGTSLVVEPFAGLVGQASPSAPRFLVNREAVGTCDQLRRGFRFHLQEEGQNWRDAWYSGDCDDGCRAFAAALGWEAELSALVESRGTALIPRAPWVAAAEGLQNGSPGGGMSVPGGVGCPPGVGGASNPGSPQVAAGVEVATPATDGSPQAGLTAEQLAASL
mmetsp:Transcript_23500/g.74096  ORF Transcript_23500/g.74096 Transcript_23500/m.74096 type:complete len:433 (-) Transcript_23500:52-1350(-)